MYLLGTGRLMARFRGVGLGRRAGLAHRGARGRLRDARRLSLPALLRRDALHWLIQKVLELRVGGARTQTLLNAGEGVMRGHVAGNELATHMKRDVERAVRRHRPRERADAGRVGVTAKQFGSRYDLTVARLAAIRGREQQVRSSHALGLAGDGAFDVLRRDVIRRELEGAILERHRG